VSAHSQNLTALQASARQVCLLRLLLLAIGLAVLTFGFEGPSLEATKPVREYLARLLLLVGVGAAVFAALARWVRSGWQLAMQLVFDLLWAGALVYCSGGVASPGVVLLFAITLTGLLALPGTMPFVMSSLSSLVLAGNALLYVTGLSPLPDDLIRVNPRMGASATILGLLATQVAALFLVDVLGQLLVRRLSDQRVYTSEVLDQLGEGVLAIDRGGSVTYANAEAGRLLGVDENGLAGRPVLEALHGVTLAPVRALLERDDLPLLERFAGPDRRQLVLRVSDLSDRRGRTIGRTLLIADETRLLVLEESARRADHLAALGEMAAGIAHEVRNPLTSLRGCAQELADINRKEGQHDAADLAGIMITEADRLARIVEDFLTLSRMRAPDRSVVDLAPLFTELDTLHRRQQLPDNLVLVFDISDDCPTVVGDTDQVRQVLLNLIGNALDAVRRVAAPRISIAAREAAGGRLPVPAVEVRVSDNGCGIPAHLQEQVFTPFFSTKSQGTGLGLSLVQRIVREHEGALRLESSVESGTVITVLLPAHSQTRTFKRALGGG